MTHTACVICLKSDSNRFVKPDYQNIGEDNLLTAGILAYFGKYPSHLSLLILVPTHVSIEIHGPNFNFAHQLCGVDRNNPTAVPQNEES